MTATLDRILGRLTMYGLVVACLGVIAAVAFLFAFFAIITPSPLEILVSLATVLTASYLTNGLLGLAFRTRPQLSSTAITALLLFFIFQPTLDPAQLGGIALAGAIAAASKYLLAFRRRHIFNPTAIGAVIVSISGLAFASWWVGTGPLLPFVAVGALAVLFRTRRLAMGGIYVVVATAITTAFAVAGGIDPASALQYALVSSPVVFFAGFMLSEPLTLPPRRWQQYAEAALVGVLGTVPFSLGPVVTSPQLALVIGNVLAFLAGQRRGIRLAFVGRRQLTPTSWEFSFQPLTPLRYTPGQFIELTLPHAHADSRGWRRVFSIASAPSQLGPREPGPIAIAVRFPDKPSSFKRTLFHLPPGQRVMATSIGGDFLLPKDRGVPLTLVAAGIGITPYVGQLALLSGEEPRRDVLVIFVASAADELAYLPELEAAGVRVAIVAPEAPETLPDGWSYLGDGPVTAAMIHETAPDTPTRATFLSGPPQAIVDLRRALRRSGARHVHNDAFIGY